MLSNVLAFPLTTKPDFILSPDLGDKTSIFWDEEGAMVMVWPELFPGIIVGYGVTEAKGLLKLLPEYLSVKNNTDNNAITRTESKRIRSFLKI